MKICYFTHEPNLTGTGQSLLDILSGIRDFNVDPIVVVRKTGPLLQELEKINIPYEIIPYYRNTKLNFIKDHVRKILHEFYSINRIKNFLLQHKIDILHNNSFMISAGMEAAYRAGIPYICHNRDFIWEDHRLTFIDENRQNFLLKNAAAAIEISEAVYQKYKSIVPDANYYILYDGINIEKYYQKHKKILRDKKVNILFAGSIKPGKRQLEAIQAIEILEKKGYQNFDLTIVGSPSDINYEKYIHDYVETHYLNNVSFIKFSPLQELRKISDIALVCSESEALGRVTIEGQLAGCLVIGAEAGGTKELIIDNETGLFYELGNIEDLANKLIYAYENPERMNQIAIAGQESAKKNMSVSDYNMKLAEIYQNVLEKK